MRNFTFSNKIIKVIKKREEAEKRVKNTVSTNHKSHAENETLLYDPKCGVSIGFIPPSLDEVSRFDRTKDAYIYTQPEMDINKWEVEPQSYR